MWVGENSSSLFIQVTCTVNNSISKSFSVLRQSNISSTQGDKWVNGCIRIYLIMHIVARFFLFCDDCLTNFKLLVEYEKLFNGKVYLA